MAEDVVETETTTEDTPAQTEGEQSPDLTEMVSDLRNQFQTFREENQAPPPPQPSPVELMDFDLDTPEIEEEEPEYEETGYEDPRFERLERVESYLVDKEMKERTAELRKLPEEFDDFTEKIPEIKSVLDDLEIYEPAMRGDAKLIRRIYLSLKAEAEAAAANDSPAEEVRRPGATLETGASSTAPPGKEESPEAQLAQELQKLGGGGDVLD